MSNLQHKKLSLLLGATSEGNAVTLTGSDFERHKVISGITGSGKSTLLAWIALSLLRQGIPFILIDPHADLARLILSLLASSDFFTHDKAYERLWFVDFARQNATIPFNVLKQTHLDHYQIANNLLEAIHRAFPGSSGTTAALDNTITYAAFVLAENGLPLTQLQRLLLDFPFRAQLLKQVHDPQIQQFFDFKFADKASSQLIDSTMRRLDLLVFSPALRHSLGHKENKINFRSLMDNQISCLLSLGGLDDQSKRLLGCLIMVGIEQAFLSRATLPPNRRFPYHVIVDEFPLFSASGDSFSVILEQVRKYKGTLYLGHQTYSQLSKGMIGSLQNALPIIMKAGTDDSSTLVDRFYRPVQEEPAGWFADVFRQPSASPFASITNLQQARQLFENLERQEALVRLNHEVKKIVTPTLPIKRDEKKLSEIENEYARRLLTPLSHMESDKPGSHLVLVSSAHESSIPIAKRRAASDIIQDREPLKLITGDYADDILLSLYHFHYLTLLQLCKLLGRESSINHVRSKVKKLVEDGLVETTPLARASSGKPPIVYFLSAKGIKQVADACGLLARLPATEAKHGYLEHSLECSDVLIQSVLLPRVEPSYTLIDLKHERTLKNNPCKISDGVFLVPDGWVHLRHSDTEDIGICYEVDRATEEKEKIISKLNNYVAFASGIYQRIFGLSSLTIAFIISAGGQKRVKQLLTWAEQTLTNNKEAASLFLFGDIDLKATDPKSLLMDSIFFSPFDTTPHTLVETL